MSLGSDNTTGRDAAIRNARLRLIQLQAATHRVKAELARLEASPEDAVADKLLREDPQIGERELPLDSWKRVLPSPQTVRPAIETDPSGSQSLMARQPASPTTRRDASVSRRLRRTRGSLQPSQPSPLQIAAAQRNRKKRTRGPVTSRKLSPAWLLSLAVHVALLGLLGLATFVTLQSNSLLVLAHSVDSTDPLTELIEIEVEQLPLEETEFDSVEVDIAEWEEIDPELSNLSDLAELVNPDPDYEIGLADSLPDDIRKLMTTSGSGKTAGGGQRTSFFGTAAEGQRFVFVVDNSGSMQEGRMETTFLELSKSVRAMRRDQHFYVVFYSDQVYPLFFPESVHALVPVTKENIRKLEAWLKSVELCTGGRLREAMELVVELEPQVVYLLSDGEIGSERTMQYMTEPNSWPFAIHTFGMTVRGPDAADKLSRIANAHGGTFRMVRPNPAAIQLANRRPIKYNRTQGVTWGSKVRAR